jgi:4-hydroxy-4-methyl-2-oxoglutarate aldolase
LDIEELRQRLSALYLAAVSDALYELGIPEAVLPTSLRPLTPSTIVVGEAYTVRGQEIAPPVGWEEGVSRMRPYLAMFEKLTPGSVIVSTTEGSSVGHFGELTANAAQRAGATGIILDGNLRDVRGLLEIGFPVFYRDLSPLNGIGRWEMITEQEPVTIGGVTVSPGDIVYGEFEGILVIRRQDAEQVLLAAERIANAEGRVRDDVRQGLSPSDSFDRHGHI